MSIEAAIGPAADFLEENGFDDAAALLRGTSAYAAVFDSMNGGANYLPAMLYAIDDDSAREQVRRLCKISRASLRELRHLQTGRLVSDRFKWSGEPAKPAIDGPGEYRTVSGEKATIDGANWDDPDWLYWRGTISGGREVEWSDSGAPRFSRGDARRHPLKIVSKWDVPLSEYVRAVRISEPVAFAASRNGRESMEALVRIAIERGMNRENADLFEFTRDECNRVYIVTDPLAPTPPGPEIARRETTG